MDLRDQDTLRKAYEAHGKSLYNLAYRLVRDRQWAEDLLQETFVRAHTRADTFREGGQVSTWLYRICMNLCYDHLRAQKYRRAASLDAPAMGAAEAGDGAVPTFGQSLASDEPGTATTVERRDAATTIRGLIEALPERERSVVLLRQYHNMTFQEIGEILGLTSRTAQNCLRRAKDKLAFGLREAGLGPAFG